MIQSDAIPGTLVTLDCSSTNHDIKQYVFKNCNKPFPIVKITKSGLVQLLVDTNKTISVPLYSISLWNKNESIN